MYRRKKASKSQEKEDVLQHYHTEFFTDGSFQEAGSCISTTKHQPQHTTPSNNIERCSCSSEAIGHDFLAKQRHRPKRRGGKSIAGSSPASSPFWRMLLLGVLYLSWQRSSIVFVSGQAEQAHYVQNHFQQHQLKGQQQQNRPHIRQMMYDKRISSLQQNLEESTGSSQRASTSFTPQVVGGSDTTKDQYPFFSELGALTTCQNHGRLITVRSFLTLPLLYMQSFGMVVLAV